MLIGKSIWEGNQKIINCNVLEFKIRPLVEASDCNEHRFDVMDEVYLSLLRMNIYAGHPFLLPSPLQPPPFYHFLYYRELQRTLYIYIYIYVEYFAIPRPFAKDEVYRDGIGKMQLCCLTRFCYHSNFHRVVISAT